MSTENAQIAHTGAARVHVKLSQRAYKELKKLSQERECTATEVIHDGLSLLSYAHEELKNGNGIFVLDADKKILQQLVML